jgi:hypothetical protein
LGLGNACSEFKRSAGWRYPNDSLISHLSPNMNNILITTNTPQQVPVLIHQLNSTHGHGLWCMGFDEARVRQALQQNDNNAERAKLSGIEKNSSNIIIRIVCQKETPCFVQDEIDDENNIMKHMNISIC